MRENLTIRAYIFASYPLLGSIENEKRVLWDVGVRNDCQAGDSCKKRLLVPSPSIRVWVTKLGLPRPCPPSFTDPIHTHLLCAVLEHSTVTGLTHRVYHRVLTTATGPHVMSSVSIDLESGQEGAQAALHAGAFCSLSRHYHRS